MHQTVGKGQTAEESRRQLLHVYDHEQQMSEFETREKFLASFLRGQLFSEIVDRMSNCVLIEKLSLPKARHLISSENLECSPYMIDYAILAPKQHYSGGHEFKLPLSRGRLLLDLPKSCIQGGSMAARLTLSRGGCVPFPSIQLIMLQEYVGHYPVHLKRYVCQLRHAAEWTQSIAVPKANMC